MQLHPDDRHYTTFITQWGRYRYLVGPQGYAATGDAYTRRLDEIVGTVPDKVKCIDDVCLWKPNIYESFFQAVDWLDLCGRNGVTLNPPKFVFAADEVDFAGFNITLDSVKPCEKYLRAIYEFPTPKNIADVRSWFGLLNQVAYAFAIAPRMQPFRHLLKTSTFSWSPELQSIFEESKAAVVQEIEEGVKIFDKLKSTCLATDWSKEGIGFWLFQKHCKCVEISLLCCYTGWKVSLVGSRFTHPAESRYAPIEGEALAVVYALDKARFFVQGCPKLIVATDHKPLLRVFNDRSLDIPNPRLRNLKEKTLRYRFAMHHVPGAKNRAPDALSRHPSGPTTPERLNLPEDVDACNIDQDLTSVLAAIRCNDEEVQEDGVDQELLTTAVCAIQSNLRSVTWDMIRKETASDLHMIELSAIIESGFPSTRDAVPLQLREYFQFRDSLYILDGVVMYNNRTVIPKTFREEITTIIHLAHQGTTSMTSRVESSVFWPGITADIASARERCYDCNKNAPSQPSAPPHPPTVPMYPFQCVCADFFSYIGNHYLVIVDRYSNWPIVERSTEGAQGLIKSLKRTFATFGISEELASDGGPEFVAHCTTKFLTNWGIHHRLSSVAFPHSNCRAEIAVKTVKRMLESNTGRSGSLDTDALQAAMLQYRNTPDPVTKMSPAMCVFGRSIRDFVPVSPGQYAPHPEWREMLDNREEVLRERHDRAGERWKEHTKQLLPLKVGDHVRLQNQTGPHPNKWDRTGCVVEVRQHDQYVIRVDGSGRQTLRNRKFLRAYTPQMPISRRIEITDDLRYLPQQQPSSPTIAPSTTVLPQLTPTVRREPETTSNNNDGDLPIDTNMDNSLTVPEPVENAPARDDHATTTIATKKLPLALRRLASFNKDGRIGLTLQNSQDES